MKFEVIIPARYQSSRLPGKPLADIGGKPMVQHVYEQALQSDATRVTVATDDERIRDVVEGFGGHVVMTSPEHNSGTERLAEVVNTLGLDDETIVVNIQGDEPLIPPSNINTVADSLHKQTLADMATLSTPISRTDEWLDPNVCKVVCDHHGYALYFTRSAVPHDRDGVLEGEQELKAKFWRRHIGIYGYRAGFIRRYVAWPQSPLEIIESLEQLRVLWQGEKIHVQDAPEVPPAGVDTHEHLEAVRKLVAAMQE